MTARRLFALALALIALPTGAAASGPSLDARVDALFVPARAAPDWSRPVFAAEVTRRIAAWRKIARPGAAVSALDAAGWFCPCRDGLGGARHFTGRAYRALPGGLVAADVGSDPGDGTERHVRLVMRRQGERWKVADLFTPALPRGLVAALDAQIARGTRH